MGELARTAACRFSIALGLVLAALALSASSARAGTYEVVACDTAPGGAHGSWVPRATDKMGTGQHCPSAGREAGGLWAGNGVNVGTIPAFAASQQYFDAPPGTSIVFFAARYMFRRFDPYWRLGVFADSFMLHGCEPAAHETGCFFNSQSIDVDSTWGWQPGQIHQVSIVTACGSGTGCRSDAAAPSGDRAGVRLYGATVRIHDDSAPSVWPTGSGIYANGWHRGTQTAAYAGSDNVGFRRTRLYVDGKEIRDDDRDGCDFTQRRPCQDIPGDSYAVNTTGIPDGDHVVRVEGVDAAGNVGGFNHAFKSDNTAPDGPSAIDVEGGSDWRQTNRFNVTWRNPPSASPIQVAHYRLCNADTGACTDGARGGEGISSIPDLSVPAPGHYTMRVWLEDKAGNVRDTALSDPVHLRFDNVPPGEAEPVRGNGWLNADEAGDYEQPLRLRDGAFTPVSGIAGYSVTTDGSDPDSAIDVVGTSFRIPSLQEGTTTVKARAISGAHVPSPDVGITEIRVDKTAPSVASRTPDPGRWHREPPRVVIEATDQAHLSGMDAAGEGLPAEEGAYIEYRLNGRRREVVRGAATDLRVVEDGEHSVTFAAYDVAGNASPERSVSFKFDQSAPELVVFEAPEADNPRRVVVAASDKTSGVANASVEMRRLNTDRPWIELPVAREGDRFVATIDDESVDRGVYELRARVSDQAGNEATGNRRRDGSQATVDTAALREGSKLTAALVSRSKTKTKKVCSKKRPGTKRKCRKKKTKQPGGTLVNALNVPFGKGAVARGTLETEAGAPLGNAVVDVHARSLAAGSEFERVAAVRTDLKGAFSYTVPAGYGRAVRFRFEGDGRTRPTEEAVTLKVAAAATITPSHRTRRNGQSVTFKGKLRSQPIPAAGKVLDLQAFYRGKWRTFATPRADAKGKWSYRYRFGATRGKVSYRFRVLIRPESAYPYDVGYSNTVNVVVRGR
jgi:hypothetical protein